MFGEIFGSNAWLCGQTGEDTKPIVGYRYRQLWYVRRLGLLIGNEVSHMRVI